MYGRRRRCSLGAMPQPHALPRLSTAAHKKLPEGLTASLHYEVPPPPGIIIMHISTKQVSSLHVVFELLRNRHFLTYIFYQANVGSAVITVLFASLDIIEYFISNVLPNNRLQTNHIASSIQAEGYMRSTRIFSQLGTCSLLQNLIFHRQHISAKIAFR